MIPYQSLHRIFCVPVRMVGQVVFWENVAFLWGKHATGIQIAVIPIPERVLIIPVV